MRTYVSRSNFSLGPHNYKSKNQPGNEASYGLVHDHMYIYTTPRLQLKTRLRGHDVKGWGGEGPKVNITIMLI